MKKLSSILMLVFLGMMAISFTACSSDDDVDPTQQYRNDILGGWYYNEVEYWFSDDGTGEYDCGDVFGSFHYTVEGTDVQMRLFKYMNTATGSIWDGEDKYAHYDPEKNTLRIDGRTFTRDRPATKSAKGSADSVAKE